LIVFRLDEKNHSAMYVQVMDNIKEMIVTDVWAENSKIPSVRELSEQLTLNPNTVQKAYRELEREGYIYTVSGKGTFVRGKSGIRRDPAMVDEMKSKVREAYRGLLLLGYNSEEAAAVIQGTVIEAAAGMKSE
jgi:GntR family transcriptional regulator